MLVGSWAEFVYRECGLLKGFEPNIRTTDADFLIRNLRKPIPPANIVAMARERTAVAAFMDERELSLVDDDTR